jgi:hypothetical protein
MLSNKKTLIVIGATAGVAATILFASLFSSMTASAQMMMPSTQNQTNSMMMRYGQNHFSASHNMGMFSVMGMSMVKNVAVTGVSVTGDNEISVNVRYTGNETSTPGIGVFVMTNHMDMMKEHMEAMMYGQNYGMGGGSSMMMDNNNMVMNSTQGNNSTMMQSAWTSHGGSNFVKSGWTASGNTIKIKLDGTSAYNAHDIMVMVSPYLE